jgi:hypothetical protein
MNQKKVASWGRFQFKSVAAYWITGVMGKGLMSFFNTPTLQYSITPPVTLQQLVGSDRRRINYFSS